MFNQSPLALLHWQRRRGSLNTLSATPKPAPLEASSPQRCLFPHAEPDRTRPNGAGFLAPVVIESERICCHKAMPTDGCLGRVESLTCTQRPVRHSRCTHRVRQTTYAIHKCQTHLTRPQRHCRPRTCQDSSDFSDFYNLPILPRWELRSVVRQIQTSPISLLRIKYPRLMYC